MKVHNSNNNRRQARKIQDWLPKFMWLRVLLTSLGVFIAMSILFFGILSYGAHLKEIGVMTYFKNSVLDAARLDFSFIKNFTRGQLNDLQKMHIDIKFKHLLRIQYLREQALEKGIISSQAKEEEFPAKIAYKGQMYDVKLSLTGLIAESHLKSPDRWSFQVKVRGDNTIEGLKRFGMLRPATRGYMTDWLGFELMKDRGLMALRVDYVNVEMNGKDLGTYYLEERFDKYLIENNHLREGILFKLNGEFSPYQKSKLLADPAKRQQLLMLQRMWQAVVDGQLDPARFFDLDKMARVFVVCDLMNNKHPLALQNLRFYFNPVTGLVEPIAREWEKLERTDINTLRLFLEKPVDGDRHIRLQKNPILTMIYDHLEFKRRYIYHAEIMSEKEHLDQVIHRMKSKMKAIVDKVHGLWPFYEVPLEKLYDHQKYMHSVLFPETHQIEIGPYKLNGANLCLSIKNRQYLPLEISNLTWRDSIMISPIQPIILDTKLKKQQHLFEFKLPGNIEWTDEEINHLSLHYKLLGSQAANRKINIRSRHGSALTDLVNEDLQDLNSSPFLKIIESERIIKIPSGSSVISKSITIPEGYLLQVASGAEIDFIKGAGLESYSPIIMDGEEHEPIIVKSSDSSGKGIKIIGTKRRSSFNYVKFEKLGNVSTSYDAVVNILESPVDITNCTFSKLTRGTSLYFYKSDFLVAQSIFDGIEGSAFKSEYSKGGITNCSFTNIIGSAIVAIESEIDVELICMTNIGSNGIQATKNSFISAHQLDIRNIMTGIAVSSWSTLYMSDVHVINGTIGVTAVEEGSGSGPAMIKADRIDMQKVLTHHKIAGQSQLILDGETVSLETQTL